MWVERSSLASGARSPGENSALLLTVCADLSKIPHLMCLGFLSCKMGIIVVQPPQVGVNNDFNNVNTKDVYSSMFTAE